MSACLTEGRDVGCEGSLSWSRLGAELMTEGRYQAAVAVLNEAVRRDPSDGHTWLALGRAYCQLGRLTEARAALFIAQANHGPFAQIKLWLSRIADAHNAKRARA